MGVFIILFGVFVFVVIIVGTYIELRIDSKDPPKLRFNL